MNDDLFNCTDEFHICVNTRGSYKCVCGQNLYFIDGKCRGNMPVKMATSTYVVKVRVTCATISLFAHHCKINVLRTVFDSIHEEASSAELFGGDPRLQHTKALYYIILSIFIKCFKLIQF